MANLVWAESGTAATQDFSFYSSTVGTVSSDTSAPFFGPRSAKLSTSSPAVAAQIDTPLGTVSDTGSYISWYWKYDTTPANSAEILAIRTSGGALIFGLLFQDTRKMLMIPSGTGSAVGTTVLSPNTWYQLTLTYTITSTSTFQFDLYVGNVLDVSCTTGTLSTTGSSFARFEITSGWGANSNTWVTIPVITNGTPSGGYLGDLRATNKRPNANGGINTFDTTVSTTNSGYGSGNSIYVNEQPLATTGSRKMAGAGTAAENFATEGASTGDVDISNLNPFGYMAWIQGSGVSTDTIYSNGPNTVPDGPSTIGSTTQVYWKVTTSQTLPSSSSNVGMGRPTNNATDAILNECGIIIVLSVSQPYLLVKN